MTFSPGAELGPYRLLSPLGSGGMGEVYKAVDTRLQRTVAIKILPSEAVSNPRRQTRFVQEARAASALDHPNIIGIYDIAEAEGVPFIVMQYVPGKTLRQVMSEGRTEPLQSIDFGIQIAEGLSRAHGQGIIHRDLKPENIMVSEERLVKILDFGLCKLVEPLEREEAPTRDRGQPVTEEGHVPGTPAYMSPEQVQGKEVDARSDIFSFGSILYEMVTGRRPFSGQTAPLVIDRPGSADPGA